MPMTQAGPSNLCDLLFIPPLSAKMSCPASGANRRDQASIVLGHLRAQSPHWADIFLARLVTSRHTPPSSRWVGCPTSWGHILLDKGCSQIGVTSQRRPSLKTGEFHEKTSGS